MEYMKIINLLDNTPNQPTKCRKRNWVEINYESQGVYNVGSQNFKFKSKFKTSMLRSSLGDFSEAYIIIVKGTITVPNTTGAGAAVNNTNKKSNI